MNIKTRNILIISILVMFLFVGTFAGFVYWIYALNDKTAEFYSMKADRESKLKQATDMRKNIEDAEALNKRMNGFVVPKEGETAFLEDIEAMASSTFSSSFTTNFKEESGPSGYSFAVVDIMGNGTYTSVRNFLRLAENFPMGVEVSQVSLEKIPSENKKNPQWKLALRMRALIEK